MDVKRYHYWCFYYHDAASQDDIWELYAYTDKKEYAKQFEATRNMKKFRKKSLKLTRKEVNYLADNYQGEYLRESLYLTKLPSKHKYDITYVKFITTEMEDITARSWMSTFLTIKLWDNCWFDYHIFNDDLIEVLRKLHYTDGYDMIMGYENEDEIDNEDTLIPDEFAMFLHLYKHTIYK